MNGKFRPPLPPFIPKERRPLSSAGGDLVRLEPPVSGPLPATASPSTRGVDVCAWLKSNRDRVEVPLFQHGAILFRGFDIESPCDFERFVSAVSGEPLPYVERSSPRTTITGHIYSSTEYPAQYSIFLHCENSYQIVWPLKIFFYCQLPAEQGGETPIADTRRILQGIDPRVRERFAKKGVMYVRNFGPQLGLPWQMVFQTDDRRAVELHCARRGITYEWNGSDRLRTTQIGKAIHIHPVTGERVWFNHAVFFNVSTLEPATRDVLQRNQPAEDLPSNTYYGDGSPIEPNVLDDLRAIHRAETVRVQWRQNDVLMLDNMLAAHGRYAYRGQRKVLVAMTEQHIS